MAMYPSSGARPATPTQPPAPQGTGPAMATQYASATGKIAAKLPTVDPVGPNEDVVSISRQGLQAPTGPARSTSENAQSFMNTFARRLFGGEANTASVAYNLSSFSSAISDAAPASSGGTVRSTALALDQRASFTGIGQIDTEEGRSFNFELKVKYEPNPDTVSAAARSEPVFETPDVLVLTGKPLPEIQFPGSLDDLFKLLSRELRTEVSGAVSDASGELTLRLMRLVDRAALLAPRARPDDPEATSADRAKAVASTYGSAPVRGDVTQA